jgi:hypothetical protein
LAISYKVDSAAGVVLEHWIGEITANELSAHWRLLTSDLAAMECKGSLADISECVIRFSSEQLFSLIRSVVIPAIPTRKWKAAVLVTKPVQHGVAMQYGAWTDDVHEMTIFTDRALALDWLMS